MIKNNLIILNTKNEIAVSVINSWTRISQTSSRCSVLRTRLYKNIYVEISIQSWLKYVSCIRFCSDTYGLKSTIAKWRLFEIL